MTATLLRHRLSPIGASERRWLRRDGFSQSLSTLNEIPAEVCELDLKNGERSRRRVRDLVTQLAFEGRSENEIERARISMMARSGLLHARAGYRSARPVAATLQIQL